MKTYQTKTMKLWNTTDELIRFLKTPPSVTVRATKAQDEAQQDLQDAGRIYLEAMRELSAAQAVAGSGDPGMQEQLNRIEAKLDALAGALAEKLEAEASAGTT